MAVQAVVSFLVLCIAVFDQTHAVPKTAPAGALYYVNGYGNQYLRTVALPADNATYQSAIATYNAANATCIETRDSFKVQCKTCIVDSCNATINACPAPVRPKPNFFDALGGLIEAKVLDPVGEFFVDDVGGAFEDVGDWFAGDFSDFFTDDVGGAFEDAFDATGDFFTDDVGGAFEDFGEFVVDDIGGAFDDAANEVADFFTDDVADFFTDDVADFFTDDVAGAFEDVGDFFVDDIGGAFSSLFDGRRKRSATAPPECDEFKKAEGTTDEEYKIQLAEACSYYKSTTTCPSCDISVETRCPNLQSQLDAVKAARVNYLRWKTHGYNVASISYDTINYDPATDGFKNMVAEVQLFGATHTITLSEAHSLGSKASVKVLAEALAMKTLAA